ncbi:hypothetical protein [Acidisoma cladoniae]|uniref:hypothetical protein n=1 Tax=Acidisoma cladoniae TaxID=3040935 RepID=UPI00254ECCA7|nr:hypothetical protein [Acidisoma sp. PAMC 29798]
MKSIAIVSSRTHRHPIISQATNPQTCDRTINVSGGGPAVHSAVGGPTKAALSPAAMAAACLSMRQAKIVSRGVVSEGVIEKRWLLVQPTNASMLTMASSLSGAIVSSVM